MQKPSKRSPFATAMAVARTTAGSIGGIAVVAVAAAAAVFLPAASAGAVAFKFEFSASGFPAGAPEDPLSGTIFYEAPASTGLITSVTSMSLTIAGFSYDVSDVTSMPVGSLNAVFGNANDGAVLAGTNDVGVGWSPTTGELTNLTYATAGTASTFQFTTVDSSSVEIVPEPGTLPLAALGLAWIAAGRARRSRPPSRGNSFHD